MNILADIANFTYLTAYSVRDVLLLRILSVCGGGLLLPYYYYQAVPLWVAIYWGLAFIALNLFWIVRLTIERRPVKLSDEEQHLYRLLFRTLTPREMVELLKLATWQDRDVGDVLEQEGQVQDTLNVIVAGRAHLLSQGREAGELGEGAFVGKVSFLTDEKAPFTVIVKEPVRLVSWNKSEMRKFLQSKSDLLAAMQLTLGYDLVSSLEAARRQAAITQATT